MKSFNLLKLVKKFFNIFFSIIISTLYPAIEALSDIIIILSNTFEINYKLVTKILYETIKDFKKNIQISLIIYYFILLISELYILIKVLLGKIEYYDFASLFVYSGFFILFNIIFVLFLNKHYKSKKFNYIIYFQILFSLPLGVVYWIANIEGHNLYLKDLNSDQWISLFNTIILYFSGCLIGIVTLYKNIENNKEPKISTKKV